MVSGLKLDGSWYLTNPFGLNQSEIKVFWGLIRLECELADDEIFSVVKQRIRLLNITRPASGDRQCPGGDQSQLEESLVSRSLSA